MTFSGPGLLENELATFTADWILDQWDAGVPADEIRRRRAAAVDDDVWTPFGVECVQAAWVKTLWEIGALVPDERDRLRALLDDGASLELWAANGGAAMARKRKALLERLLVQVATPKATLRGRKPTSVIKQKLFSVGDCLTITTASRDWHALVTHVYEKRGRCQYVIGPVQSVRQSTQHGFEEGTIVGHWIGTPGGRIFGIWGVWFDHRVLVRDGNPFTTVAQVQLDPSRCTVGSYSGDIPLAAIEKRFMQIKVLPGHHYVMLPLAEVVRQAPGQP